MSLNLSEPYFNLIRTGIKTAEGRVFKGKVCDILPGMILKFCNNENDFYHVKVTYLERYNNFYEMMTKRINVLLPNILDPSLSDDENFKNGVSVYKQFFTDEQEKLGVICIGVEIFDEL